MKKEWAIGAAVVGLMVAAGITAALMLDRGAQDEAVATAGSSTMQVWKTPTCGCCGDWVDYMRGAGFALEVRDVSEREMIDVKRRHGLPVHLSSCHTAVVGGYVVEGHVPAEDVRRMLEERPDARGIAVPGMPLGSPGMEFGDRIDSYEVLLFDRDGATRVFARHP